MQPTVLLDCDGILRDFIGAALLTLRKLSGEGVPHEAITTWDVFASVPEHLQKYKQRVYDLMAAELGCLSIAPYAAAKEGVRRLRELADVVIVTSPFYGSKTWTHETELWLHTHFDIPGKKVIHAQEKHHVTGDIFVDDKTSHVIAWNAAHPTGIAVLWSMPYNKKDTHSVDTHRAWSWSDLHAIVKGWVHKQPAS